MNEVLSEADFIMGKLWLFC